MPDIRPIKAYLKKTGMTVRELFYLAYRDKTDVPRELFESLLSGYEDYLIGPTTVVTYCTQKLSELKTIEDKRKAPSS